MVSSVVLLIVLQFLWLRNSYEQAYFDFRRESSLLFRSSVFNLRDSLFVKNIEPVRADQLEKRHSKMGKDSFNVKFRSVDSLPFGSKIRVYISSNESIDSNVNFLRPLASSVKRLDRRQDFIIRIGPDTLSMDTLNSHYQGALRSAGIQQSFIIRHFVSKEHILKGRDFMGPFYHQEGPHRPNPYQDSLITDRVNLNPVHSYAAIFPGASAAIIKEITPQILFSLLLTFITTISFVVMYRGLRSQERLHAIKNDFISNVTHELKTPVATVSVALEALKDFHVLDNRERTKEYLDIAQRELNRLTLMTDKILKASAFENQGISFSKEIVNLDMVIEKVVSSLKLVFEKHHLHVIYKREGLHFEVQGSPMHLTNVVYNLLDNAIKYSKEQSSIEVLLKQNGSLVEFSVKDEGIGIAKEYQKKIFEKFFRVPTGDVHNVKGYGLGLNYVCNVVKEHHGTIDVVSEAGKGSLFVIHLPKGSARIE
jgi:two-component system phosphate regulon sensor histidine kinase PhoR